MIDVNIDYNSYNPIDNMTEFDYCQCSEDCAFDEEWYYDHCVYCPYEPDCIKEAKRVFDKYN